MSIGLSFNTGVSFGLFSSFPIVVLILSLVIIFSVGAFFFLKVYKKELNRLESIGFSLLLAGALSNLIERIFYGRITDFIKIGWWPMFNIADSFICVGAGLLVVALVRKEKR
jgi:signal peptidase II